LAELLRLCLMGKLNLAFATFPEDLGTEDDPVDGLAYAVDEDDVQAVAYVMDHIGLTFY
jgi:hypothetical protein